MSTALPFAELTPTSFKAFAGLHGDQALTLCDKMTMKVKWSTIGTRVKNAKKSRLWEMLYLHPENNIVHPSRSMLLRLVEGLCATAEVHSLPLCSTIIP